MINEISKHHNRWIAIAHRCGCGDFSEDIVQEMYLKVLASPTAKKNCVNDGKVNLTYIGIIVRNMAYDLNKVKNKVVIISDEELTKLNLTEEHNELETLNEIIQEEIKDWCNYDKLLFIYHYYHSIPQREISRRADISLRSINNTIKNAKERIKSAIEKERA